MGTLHHFVNINQITQSTTGINTSLNQFFILVKLFISTCGTFIIFIGAIMAIYRYAIYRFINPTKTNLNNIRLDLARTIILGLEFYIASDVIETTITPDFQSLGILCVLVIIRTILNFSLHKEVKELSSIPGSGVTLKDGQQEK